MWTFLLTWDPFTQALFILPAVLYLMGPRTHPIMSSLDVAGFIGAAIVVIRRGLRAEAEIRAAAAPEGACRWRKIWAPADFLARLTLFLRYRGWRVVSSDIIEPDRVLLVVKKEKCCLAILCLRPGAVPASTDVEAVRQTCLQANASRSAIVTETKFVAPLPAAASGASLLRGDAMFMLSFSELDQIDEVVGLA
jgi:hypothetical protein